MTMLQATTISAAFVFGMVLALLGSLKLALAKRLNLGEGRVGLLLSALNAAVIPLMLLAGCLIDLVGVRFMLIGGSLVTAAAVGSLGLRPTYGRAFGSLLLAGLGSAGLGARPRSSSCRTPSSAWIGWRRRRSTSAACSSRSAPW